VTKIVDQAEAGKMSNEASEASCTVLTFVKALQHA
jgi:hypothetical protein